LIGRPDPAAAVALVKSVHLELGGQLPQSMVDFHNISACPPARLPADPSDVKAMLQVLLGAEQCAVRVYTHICNLTFGKDPRTYDMASRILQEEVEHEAWFIELLSKERDNKVRPSGHFRRGEPGEAPYSKNRPFYNP